MNLKIKVNSPEESIKAQRAFFRLGFTLDISFEDLDNNGFLKWGGVFGFVAMDGKLTYTSFQSAFDGFASVMEITLPDLEALAAKARQPEPENHKIEDLMQRLGKCELYHTGNGLWSCKFQMQKSEYLVLLRESPIKALLDAVYCVDAQKLAPQQPQETPFERLERVFNEYLVQNVPLAELRNWWRERAGIKTTNVE